MERRGFALTLSYRGTHFAGFAAQPGRRSVEGVLKAALARQGVGCAPLSVAGRTAAGVHARQQVVSFRTRSAFDPEALRRALGAEPDLWLRDVRAVGPSFHARASAVSRRYLYRLSVGGPPSPLRCVLPAGRFDWDAAAAVLAAQVGTQDRTRFTLRPPAAAKVTTLHEARLERVGRHRARVWFRADGYTRHLVRNWLAAAIAAATGAEPPRQSARGFHGRPAPAEGLWLWEVDYGAALSTAAARR